MMRDKLQMNKIRRLYLFFLLMVVLVISTVFLTGCQSTDKKESYFDTTGIEYSIFEYDPNTNQTRVIWATTLTSVEMLAWSIPGTQRVL